MKGEGIMSSDYKFMVVLMAIVLIIIVGFSIALLCMVFSRAGEKAWKAIIPFYNQFILYKIVWGNGWLFLTLFIPYGGAIFSLVTLYKLGRVFGKGRIFSILLLIIPFIPMAILAFGRSSYLGSSKKNLVSSLIVSIVIGITVMVGYMFFISHLVSNVSDTFNSASKEIENLNLDESLKVYRNSYKDYDTSKSEIKENTIDVESKEIDLEYYDGTKAKVPVLDGATVDLNGSVASYLLDDGTSVGLYLTAALYGIEDTLNGYIDSQKGLIEEMDFYSDMKEYEISRRDNSVCKRITYQYTILDKVCSMEYIVKVEDLGDNYHVVYVLEKDGNTSDSDKYWKEVLDLYGIGVTE